MERETRFELATLALARRCSTTELLPLAAELSIPGGRKQVKPRQMSSITGVSGATSLRPVAVGTLFISHNLAVAHVQDAAGDRSRLGIVRNHQRGLAQFPIRPQQHVQHGIGVLRIQVAGWLVGQHNRRPRNQRPRDRHALLFAAAQLRGPVLQPP